MRGLVPAWGGAALVLSATFAAPVAAQPPAPDPRPLGLGLATFAVPADPEAAGAPAPVEPTGILPLSGALAAALLGNPSLAARSYEIRAREAAELQAGLRPSPTLSLEVEDVLGSGEYQGVRLAQTTLQLGQLVELGGKRAARMRLAAAERQLSGWDYEAARVEVLTNAADAFIEVLAAQERLSLAEDGLAVARAVRSVAAARFEAGIAAPADEIRADVAVEAAGVEHEHAYHELETTRTALVAMWGGVEARFERAEGDLGDLPALPPLADLQRRAADGPDLARWPSEVEARDAALARARSQRIPDATIAAGPRHLNGPGDAALVFNLSVPLPLWNRNQGAIAEAAWRRAQAASEQRAAQVRVTAEVASARTALRAAAEEAALLRERVVPGLERAVTVLRRGYEEGRNSQLEVLEAERARLAAREQHLRTLVEAHHSALQIERLTGAPMEEVP